MNKIPKWKRITASYSSESRLRGRQRSSQYSPKKSERSQAQVIEKKHNLNYKVPNASSSVKKTHNTIQNQQSSSKFEQTKKRNSNRTHQKEYIYEMMSLIQKFQKSFKQERQRILKLLEEQFSIIEKTKSKIQEYFTKNESSLKKSLQENIAKEANKIDDARSYLRTLSEKNFKEVKTATKTMDKSIDKIDSEKKKNSCEKNFNKIFKVLEELKVSIDNLDGKKEIEENQIQEGKTQKKISKLLKKKNLINSQYYE